MWPPLQDVRSPLANPCTGMQPGLGPVGSHARRSGLGSSVGQAPRRPMTRALPPSHDLKAGSRPGCHARSGDVRHRLLARRQAPGPSCDLEEEAGALSRLSWRAQAAFGGRPRRLGAASSDGAASVSTAPACGVRFTLRPRPMLRASSARGGRVVGAGRGVIERQAVARPVALDIQPVLGEVTLERLIRLAVDEGDERPGVIERRIADGLGFSNSGLSGLEPGLASRAKVAWTDRIRPDRSDA